MNTRVRILFCSAATILLAFGLMLLACSGCGGKGSPGTTTPPPTGTGNPTGTNTGNPGDSIPRDLKWGVQPEAPQSYLDALANQIKNNFAVSVWKSTEGQMYLNRQTLKNNVDKGPFYSQPELYEADFQIVITNLNSEFVTGTGSSMGVSMDTQYGWLMGLPGIIYTDNFLHEFGHGEWSKDLEEYSCSPCAMSRNNKSRPNDFGHFCDEADCKVAASNPAAYCWENYILKKHPSWTHTGRDPGGHPTCIVDIIQ